MEYIREIENTDFQEASEQEYGDLKYQKGMLQDLPRTEAYYNAITQNPQLFKDKVVVDVGCGTGILSFFAVRAGAKKVYAIENTSIIQVAKKIAHHNGFDNIQFINALAEQVQLPEKVDIIISEWMGHFLVHERMLESVLIIRDKYLKPDGLMFPEKGTINMALYSGKHWTQKETEFWNNDNFYGVDLTPISQKLSENFPNNILVVTDVENSHIVSNTNEIILDFKKTTLQELQQIIHPVNFTINNQEKITALALWFSVFFPGGEVLDTSPSQTSTHWKQCLIYFQKPIIAGKSVDGFFTAEVDSDISYTLGIIVQEKEKMLGKSKISSWGIKYLD